MTAPLAIARQPLKMCSDCKWCGVNWFFLFSSEHRVCHHPLSIEDSLHAKPGGDGQTFVGVERSFGRCGPTGKLWNTKADGSPR